MRMPYRNLFFQFAIFLLSGWLVSGCASVSSPTGGPRDEQPPRLKYSSPAIGAIEFKGKNIVLVFDEAIALNNLSQQLLLTPYMHNPFKHQIKKNKLFVSFEHDFPANTTIQLNFREAIKDATEGNVLKNFKLVFSTGNFIDSLSVQGKVIESLTESPVAQATVMLYDVNDTATILKGKPLYLTKTQADGSYQLENLKKGRYVLFALLDQNQNLVHDFKEQVGFVSDTLSLDTSVQRNIAFFYCDDRVPVLQRATTQKDQVFLQFSKGIEKLHLRKLTDTTQTFWYRWEKPEERKRAIVFNNWQVQDSLPLWVRAIDSVGNILTDTAVVFFGKADSTKKTKTTITQHPNGKKLSLPSLATLTWTFSYPIRPLKDTFMIAYLDSMRYQVITAQQVQISASHDSMRFQLPAFQKQVNLFWLKHSLKSLAGDSLPANSDTLLIQPPRTIDFGTISGEVVSIKNTSFVVELLSSDLKQVLQSVRNQHRFSFQLVPPGSYRLRLIIDENNNGRWDTGRLQPRLQQPEKSYLLPTPITLKANWDLEGFKL